MKTIIFDSNQLSRLFINKQLYLNEDTILFIHNEELILSKNYSLYSPKSISIDFDNDKFFDIDDSSFIRELVCEHLNLEPHEVIPIGSPSPEEFNFKIIFQPDVEWQIYVCTFNVALKNANDMSDEYVSAKHTDIYVGPYRKLGNSYYYFRRILY